MTSQLSYSILQYKHSLALGECLNIGVLFDLPEEGHYFISGDIQRLKCVYPDFDANFYNLVTKNIKSKLNRREGNNLFTEKRQYSFKDYINNVLLIEDSSSLQFTEPFNVINQVGDYRKIIGELARILLPEPEIKIEETRHNEGFILKKFTDSITKKNIVIEHKMSKNKLIQSKGKNHVVHLVKPISFDLKEDRDIQNKSVTYFGYLDLLNDYAMLNNYTFDLLIGKPQDSSLIKSYENALEVLSQAPNKEIITEEKIEQYSEDIAEILSKNDL